MNNHRKIITKNKSKRKTILLENKISMGNHVGLDKNIKVNMDMSNAF